MGDSEQVLKETSYDAAPQDEYVVTEVSYDTAVADAPPDPAYEPVVGDIPPPPPRRGSKFCKIIKDGFGVQSDSDSENREVIHRYTLMNRNSVAVQVLTYGATVTSVKIPDKKGVIDDVVLGFDKFDGYTSPRNPYFGATIGRITGVIPNHVFTINHDKFFVSNNFLSSHHANGGFKGFDKVIWNSYVKNDKLILSYLSENNEEGFPGDLLVNRTYELTPKNELIIETKATCSISTPVDITSHIDFNLSSHFDGPSELYKHYLMVNADRYAQIGCDNILTGKLKKVGGTIFDLRVPRLIGRIIHRVPGDGYDHFLSLTKGTIKGVTFAARLVHPQSGRFIEVMTDQPGLLVYTNNGLYAKPCLVEGYPKSCWMRECKDEDIIEGPLIGKIGAEYIRHGGIRLVPVGYPDPVLKKKDYDTYVLHPGQTYLNTTIYKFGIIKEHKPDLAQLTVAQQDSSVVGTEIEQDKEYLDSNNPEG